MFVYHQEGSYSSLPLAHQRVPPTSAGTHSLLRKEWVPGSTLLSSHANELFAFERNPHECATRRHSIKTSIGDIGLVCGAWPAWKKWRCCMVHLAALRLRPALFESQATWSRHTKAATCHACKADSDHKRWSTVMVMSADEIAVQSKARCEVAEMDWLSTRSRRPKAS